MSQFMSISHADAAGGATIVFGGELIPCNSIGKVCQKSMIRHQRSFPMATMNVSLPDQMKEWVEEQVKSGRYGNSSDYVRDLVRKDQERAEAREKLQQLVDEARASGVSALGREDLLKRMRSKARDAIAQQKSA
jgi:antitoxin ParD1/3/4